MLQLRWYKCGAEVAEAVGSLARATRIPDIFLYRLEVKTMELWDELTGPGHYPSPTFPEVKGLRESMISLIGKAVSLPCLDKGKTRTKAHFTS